MHKSDDHVGDLHTSVVDVVLHLHRAATVPQHSRHGVAQHRVSNMPDVCRLIRVNAGVLHNNFPAAISRYGCAYLALNFPQKVCAVKIGIQVSSTCNFNFFNPWDGCEAGRDFLRDLPWRALQPFCQFKTNRRSRLAHFDFWRTLRNDRDIQAVLLLDVRA